MKTVNVSSRAKALNEILKKASRSGLILQSSDGRRFVLTSIESWEAFDVGPSDDFSEEVKRTGQNKELFAYLAKRRRGSKNIPLEKVKERLGLN